MINQPEKRETEKCTDPFLYNRPSDVNSPCGTVQIVQSKNWIQQQFRRPLQAQRNPVN
jgi:hypothetical protein